MRRGIWSWIFIAALPALSGCGIDFQGLDRFILRPWPASDVTPTDRNITFDNLRIPTDGDKTLAAWFIPARGGTARGTILIHTSIQGNVARYLDASDKLSAHHFNVFVYDWQGYGASDGIADFRNFEPDAHAAVDYLKSRPEPSAHKIVQLGLSLGTLAATAIAALTPDETIGLGLYGPFFPDQLPGQYLADNVTPLFKPVGDLVGGLWALILPPFMQPANYVNQLRVPILVITPKDDDVIPPPEQDIFYDALPEPKERYISFGGHTHAPEKDPGLYDRIISWSEQLPGALPAAD